MSRFLSIRLTNIRVSSHPILCHPDRSVPGFPTVRLSPATTFAALRKESRMKPTEATALNRKSGGAQWRDLRFFSEIGSSHAPSEARTPRRREFFRSLFRPERAGCPDSATPVHAAKQPDLPCCGPPEHTHAVAVGGIRLPSAHSYLYHQRLSRDRCDLRTVTKKMVGRFRWELLRLPQNFRKRRPGNARGNVRGDG
jgi:hypothetical protein